MFLAHIEFFPWYMIFVKILSFSILLESRWRRRVRVVEMAVRKKNMWDKGRSRATHKFDAFESQDLYVNVQIQWTHYIACQCQKNEHVVASTLDITTVAVAKRTHIFIYQYYYIWYPIWPSYAILHTYFHRICIYKVHVWIRKKKRLSKGCQSSPVTLVTSKVMYLVLPTDTEAKNGHVDANDNNHVNNNSQHTHMHIMCIWIARMESCILFLSSIWAQNIDCLYVKNVKEDFLIFISMHASIDSPWMIIY